MDGEAYRLWIAGQEVDGSGDLIPVENPATGEIFATYRSASDEDVEVTVHRTHEAFCAGVWSQWDRHRRADVLEKIAEKLSQNLSSLIALEVKQTGRVIREMNAQVPSLVRWFKYYAALIRTEERPILPTVGKLHNWVDRKPLGVVLLITPFNHPLLIAVKKVAPALAAGNCVVLKPSELTPLTSLMLGKLMQEAGLPDGAFSVIIGYGAATGKSLVSHPLVKKVDVTGGTPSGRAIGAIAGGNLARFTAELGGKAPVIVTKNANIDLAVNGVAFASFIASGQTCVAATRIIVHHDVFDEFTTKIVAKATSIRDRIGSPTNPESMMGSIISQKQLKHISALVEDARQNGLNVSTGGHRMTRKSLLDGFALGQGYFYAPTVIVEPNTAKLVQQRIWKEEVFGPVIVMTSYRDEAEALSLANDSEFGLGSAIWTGGLSEAHGLADKIQSGICWINTHHRNDPSSPWGGLNSSGVGSENGVDAYHAYTTTKSTIINLASDEEQAAEDWFREDSSQVRYG